MLSKFFTRTPSNSNDKQPIIDRELIDLAKDCNSMPYPDTVPSNLTSMPTIFADTNNKIRQQKLPTDDYGWHAYFVKSQKHEFAIIDQLNLSSGINDKMNDNTVRWWISGVYRVKPVKNESLVNYSRRTAQISIDYKNKFDEFVKNTTLKIEGLNLKTHGDDNNIKLESRRTL